MTTLVPYTATSPTNGRPTWLEVMDRGLELAEVIANTEFVPRGLRGNQAAILAAILYGHEVGLEPMQSLAKIAVIDGRPTLAAEAQRALIYRAGHELTLEEATITRATWAGRRRDAKTTQRVTWTLDDAKRARLAGRPAWQTYPRAMLVARASAELARQMFADVIGGMPATEELEDGLDTSAPAELEPAAGSDAPAAATRTRRRRPPAIAPPAEPPPLPGEPDPAPTPAPEPARTEAQPPRGHDGAPVDAANEGEKQEPAPMPDADDAAADPDAPNRAQMGKLFALFGEKGLRDRDVRLAWSERTLGRTIESSTELSSLDVSQLIEALVPLDDVAPDAPAVELPAPELPANEQAVVDALETELDATPSDEPPLPGETSGPVPYGEFPDGF